jgi:hypothetical protein
VNGRPQTSKASEYGGLYGTTGGAANRAVAASIVDFVAEAGYELLSAATAETPSLLLMIDQSPVPLFMTLFGGGARASVADRRAARRRSGMMGDT